MIYFEILNLNPHFEIDLDLAQKNFKKAQRKYHPDFLVNATETEEAESLEMTSQLNKAWQTLKNDDTRLAYILKSKEIVETNEKYTLPKSFLMEMMDLNELVDEDALLAKKQLDISQNDIKISVQKILEKNIVDLDKSEWEKIKEYYFKKKYLERIHTQLL